MNSELPKNLLDKSVLSGFFSRSNRMAKRLLGRRKGMPESVTIRRRRRTNLVEVLEVRTLLSATNIAAVRPDTGFANNLLAHYLDTEVLTGGNSSPEITFHFGFSTTSNNGVGLQGFNDFALAGDFSGVGFDQSVVARPFAGAVQWLGDTNRDTTQE